jgi:hypothetical protein
MTPAACQYSIAQFLPYPETGEFANVGVVLACPSREFIGAQFLSTKKTARITGFFDRLDKKLYRTALKYFEGDVRRTIELVGKRREHFVTATFSDLVRPRQAIFRFSSPRALMTDNPGDELGAIFSKYVERDFITKEYNEQLLDRAVRDVLVRADVRELYRADEIGNEELHIQFPFVHRRDGDALLAIKPLNLNRDQSTKIYDVGGHWVDRVRRLRSKSLLPVKTLFAVEYPNTSEASVASASAAGEIVADLKAQNIEVAASTDALAIAAFARQARLPFFA